jgi:hypothetical protein
MIKQHFRALVERGSVIFFSSCVGKIDASFMPQVMKSRSSFKRSLSDRSWRFTTIREAGAATEGKRQADAFLRNMTTPLTEYDAWAIPQ